MKIETIVCGVSNAFLIHGANASILIDTGTKRYQDKLLKCCEKANLKLIVLTHGHFDHCQNAKYLAQKCNCCIGIAREDRALLEKNEKRKLYGMGIWGKCYAWASNRNIGRNEIEESTPDILLEDGMSLLNYGIDGKIIRLAGHTKGSVGVLLSSGELFVGDAMQNIFFPSTTWCFEEEKQAKESVSIIKSLDITKVFYGHGKMTVR